MRFLGVHQQLHRGISYHGPCGPNSNFETPAPKDHGSYEPYHPKPLCNFNEYFGDEFLEPCCEKYLSLAPVGTVLKEVDMPCMDEKKFTDEELSCTGTLTEVASQILMKLLYGARAFRWDCLRTIGVLASCITIWSIACDKQLYKLMCWVKHSIKWHMYSRCGNPIAEWNLALFADSDLAGCIWTKKSTTGALLVIVASHTWIPPWR